LSFHIHFKHHKMQKHPICSFFIMQIVLALTISSVSAQTNVSLSVEAARQYALEHNKNLRNAGLNVDEAGLMLRETVAQGLPQINATVDYSNFFGSTASLGGMQGMTIEFNPTSNLGVSFTQLLFSGSYIVGIQSAKLYEEITRTSFEQTEMEILAQVTQAYYLSLIAEESRAVIEENLDNMNDLLGKTRAMVDVGMAEEVDYDQLSVQFGMLNDALRAADRQLELSLNMLRLQMGLAADVDIILTDGLVDILEQSDFGSSMTKAFELQSNPDYRLIALQTEIAEKQINMERAAYLPTLSGFYNYTEKLLKPEFDITPNHVIGLNMNIPIFSSGVRQARVRQARLNFEIAENQQELISEQLLIQEKQLRYNLNNAFEQYESQKKNLEVARRVYDNINDKYRQGMLSSLDLTTANNNYLQAENSYIAAVLQLLEAQVEMDKLLQLF
jgi:outer membrane protein